MIVDYLKDLKKDLLMERDETEKNLSNLQLKQKENEKLYQMIQEEEDLNYDLFAPRADQSKNRKRILELEKEGRSILSYIRAEEEKREKYNHKIEEMESLIQNITDMISEKETLRRENSDEKEELYRFHMLEIQETERQRISRELHDDTVQNLTSLIHKTELCSKLVEMDPVRCKLELASMTKFLREIITDTRNMIYNLRPMLYDDIGLEAAVERVLEKLELKTSRKIICFELQGEPYQLPSVVGITILRIIQEACSNALCHANSASIHVLLSYEPEHIYINVSDNGVGFDLNKINTINASDNSGFGLAMMKERVYLLSGNLNIKTEQDKGTTIEVRIPTDRKKID